MFFKLRIVLVSILLLNIHCDSYDKVLHFPEEFSSENYVLLEPDFTEVQDKISICTWIKKITDSTRGNVWLSYNTTSSAAINTSDVVLFDNGAYLLGHRTADASIASLNEWKHCCVTWSSSSEIMKLYINGVLAESVLTETSKKIGSSGTLVLGEWHSGYVNEFTHYTFSRSRESGYFTLVDSNGDETEQKGLLIAHNVGSYQIGTVCDDAFSDAGAAVICRGMGYQTAVSWTNGNPWSSIQASYDIVLDDVRCSDPDSTFDSCTYRITTNSGCSHPEDLFLNCGGVRRFTGEIYQLNVFGRSLTDDEIETMFGNGLCSYLDHSLLEDTVLGWEDVLEGYRHGDVRAVTSGCEEWNWNWKWSHALKEYMGQDVTIQLIDHLKKDHPPCCYIDKTLQFPGEFSEENYLLIRPDISKVQDKISICSWIKKTQGNEAGSVWFSYATSTDDNEIIIYDCLRPVLSFSGNRADARVNGKLNEWQHCCVTWTSAESNRKIYINGILVQSVPTTTSGTDEQDTEGGGSDIRKPFSGEIYQLNVFGRPLTKYEIETMFKNGRCSYLEHSLLEDVVLGWEDVLEGSYRHYDVSIGTSGCNHWNTLLDFLGQPVTGNLIEHLRKNHPWY